MRPGARSSLRLLLWRASLGTVFVGGAAVAVLAVLIDRDLAGAAHLADGAFVATGGGDGTAVGAGFRQLPTSLGAWGLASEFIGMLTVLAFSCSREARGGGGGRLLAIASGAGLALLFGLTGFTLRGHLTTYALVAGGSEVLHPGAESDLAGVWESAYPAVKAGLAAAVGLIGLCAALLVCWLAARPGRMSADGGSGGAPAGPLAPQRLTVSVSALAAVLVAWPVASTGLGDVAPAYAMWALAAVAGVVCYAAVKSSGPVARILRVAPRRRTVPAAVAAVLSGGAVLAALLRDGRVGFPLEAPVARGLPIGEYAVPAIAGAVSVTLFALSYFYLLSYANDLDKRRLRAVVLAEERKRPGDLDKAADMLAEAWERAVLLRGRPYLKYVVAYLEVLMLRYQCSGRAEHLDAALGLVYGEAGLYDALIGSGQRGRKDAPVSGPWRYRVLDGIAAALFHAHGRSGSTAYLEDAIKIRSYLWRGNSWYDAFRRRDTEHMFAVCVTLMHLADPAWDLRGELSKQDRSMAGYPGGAGLLDLALHLSRGRPPRGEGETEPLRPLLAVGLPQFVAYARTGDTGLREEAIARYERSRTRDHHYMAALTDRAAEARDVGRLDEVVALGRELLAVDRARYLRADILTAAGEAAWCRFLLTAEPEDFDAARACFERARDEADAPVHLRLHAVLRWAALNELPVLREFPSPERGGRPGGPGPGLSSALAAYESAARLLPALNLLSGPVGSLSGTVRRNLRFPREAVPVAVELGELERAVEFFELGQLVVQERFVLPEREDRVGSAAGPDAGELRRISALLDGLASRSDLLHAASGLFDAMRYRLDQRMRYSRELERRLGGSAEASPLGGFDRIAAAAAHGPVVLFNLTGQRGDALIVTPDRRVRHARLGPEVDSATVARLADELDGLLAGGDDRAANDMVEKLNRWLWNEVVAPAVDGLEGIDSGRAGARRIWLCPTGPLARMPLATALGPSGLRLLDIAVPVQTTSMRTLLDLRKRRSPSRRALRPAFVGVPPRPGMPESGAPGWEGELAVMARVLPEVDGRIGPEADSAGFAALLRSRHWLHLACHCSTLSGTGEVGIALADREVTAEEILAVGDLATRFAMLPICGAARTGSGAADETLHPAGALYRAGVPHVVGTLWRVYDHRIPERSKSYRVTRAFYDALERQNPDEPPDMPLAYRDALAHLTATASDDLAHWCAFVCMSA